MKVLAAAVVALGFAQAASTTASAAPDSGPSAQAAPRGSKGGGQAGPRGGQGGGKAGHRGGKGGGKAGPRGGQGGKGGGQRRNGPVAVPIDIGVGPAAHFVNGGVFGEQPVLGGLAISGEAVLDNKTIRRFKSRIPAQYRKQAFAMREVRISHPLIPRTLYLSPKVAGATVGMYGVQFRPLGLGIPLIDSGVKLSLGAGLCLTYFYLHGPDLPGNTHFIRPGVDPKLTLEIPFSDRVLMSVGWASQLYVPQRVGGNVFQVGPLDESIWHVGQAFLKLHVRIPVMVQP